MKRAIVIALALFMLAAPALADPPERGTIKLGGYTTLVFGTQSLTTEGETENIDISTQAIAADLAYFLNEKWAIGILATRDAFKMTAPDDSTFEASGMLFGPEVRYRIGLSEKADFSIVGAAGLVSSSFTSGGGEFDETDSGLSGMFILGGAFVHYYVTELISFDAGVNYQRSSVSDKDNSDEKFTAAGLGFRVGFSIYFNKR